jgi:hypothetical protein
VSLQLDAQAEGTQFKLNNTFCTTCGDKSSTLGYDIVAHLAWRDPRWALGGMAAIGDVSPGVRFAAIGPEGLLNWGMFTFYGQGGWGSTVGQNVNAGLFYGGGADIDGGFARGTVRYYPTQNILLEGTVMGAWLTMTPFNSPNLVSTDIQSTLWRVKAEAMVNPWLSVYAAYQGSRTELDRGADTQGPGFTDTLRDDRFMLGIRAWLNRDNLRNNDITGAPFDFINPINFFGPFGGAA